MGALRATLAGILVALVVAGCSASGGAPPSPTPKPSPSGPHVTYAAGDHALSDGSLGWAFCYPQTWRFLERSQHSDHPPGEDVTLDVTDSSSQARSRGQFGFIIIGTYSRGSATSLRDWLAVNIGQQIDLEQITWGDAAEAFRDRASGRRYALTPHQVIELDVRAGQSDFDSQMATRLSTWRFTY